MPDTQNIPEQKEGTKADVEHTVTAENREEALDLFKKAAKRLLEINTWHKLGGIASAEFELISADGKHSDALAKVGDYFKIDIPGPGPASGEGFDWVQVEKIEDKSDKTLEKENIMMQVRPSKNPLKKDSDTAHFLSPHATSTFIIERIGNTVSASVHGRNELPNRDTEKMADKIRNTVMAGVAAIGASHLQWKLLVTGLLADDIM